MSNIAYKDELFDLVNDLTGIHQAIAFERIDDNVVIRKTDKEKTIPYILKAPSEYFDIDETVAFYMYNDFYNYYKVFKGCDISIGGRTLTLKQKGRKSNYTLSPSEGIINGPKRVNFGESDVTLTLTKEDLDELIGMINLIKADKALISCVDNEVTIQIYTDNHDNTFEKTFECDRNSDYDENIQFNIMADRFTLIPSKKNYVIDIKKEKHMKFSLIHDDIELNIYSGTID